MQWYQEYDANEPVSQGDIFFKLPVFSVDTDSVDLTNLDNLDGIGFEMRLINAVVLSQACDLQQGNIEDIIVAEVEDVLNLELDKVISRWSFISDVYHGNRINLFIIGKHDSENTDLRINYHIVDFSRIHTIPVPFLKRFSEMNGKRIRLSTPHRELLSQQFANFMSRIGLPNEDHINKQELKQLIRNFEKMQSDKLIVVN